MDNLKMRRLLAYAGIAIITAGILSMTYGIFTNNSLFTLLGLAGIFVAFVLSRQVRRLRLIKEGKDKE